MKKIISILLILTMVFCFAGCGQKDDGGYAGMPNPMTEVESLEALNEMYGCAMISPSVMGVSDEKYFSVDSDPDFAEYQFTVNGLPYTYRFAVAGMDVDISGYWRSDNSETVFQSSDAEMSYYEGDEAKLARWFTIDGQYVLMVKDNGELDYDTFDGIVQEFKSVKPVNWNDDGSFERYKALEGYYMDSAKGVLGSFSLSGTCGRFMTMSREAGSNETYEYDIPVVFDANNNLAFEKVGITLYKSDESGITTSEEALPDGGAGVIEIQGENLVITETDVEQLKGLSFAPYSFG